MDETAKLLAPVVERLGDDGRVAAVAVVGSRASGRAAPESDVDVFVYADAPLEDTRRSLAAALADGTVPSRPSGRE